MTAVNPNRLRIAMIGTRGVPARYGGFETAIEEVGRRLADRGHQVLVYCRNPEPQTPLPSTYLGMRLVELPSVKNRSLETLSHTALSVVHLLRRTHPDAAFVFNAANSPFLPALRAARVPVATHVDGLEWRRGKWGPTGKRYYRAAEALAVRYSDALIADAQGIADYYTDEFNAPTDLISYGAPRITADTSRLAELDLAPKGFHLVVARFEMENHVDVIVEGYVRSGATLPLVVVGSAPYADAYTWPTTASGCSEACGTRSCSMLSTPAPWSTTTATPWAARTPPSYAPSALGPRWTPSTSPSTARFWARPVATGLPPTTWPPWSPPPSPTSRHRPHVARSPESGRPSTTGTRWPPATRPWPGASHSRDRPATAPAGVVPGR